MNATIICVLMLSHLLAVAIGAKWTAKLIYNDIKTNYHVDEFVRKIEEIQSRHNHPTARPHHPTSRPQFYDLETEEKFEEIIDNFDN